MSTTEPFLCDVCGKSAQLYVRDSALGSCCSLAYCGECIRCGAEPYWLAVDLCRVPAEVKVTDAFKETFLDNFAEWARPRIWASVLRAGKSAEEWWVDIAAAEQEAEKAATESGGGA